MKRRSSSKMKGYEQNKKVLPLVSRLEEGGKSQISLLNSHQANQKVKIKDKKKMPKKKKVSK